MYSQIIHSFISSFAIKLKRECGILCTLTDATFYCQHVQSEFEVSLGNSMSVGRFKKKSLHFRELWVLHHWPSCKSSSSPTPTHYKPSDSIRRTACFVIIYERRIVAVEGTIDFASEPLFYSIHPYFISSNKGNDRILHKA